MGVGPIVGRASLASDAAPGATPIVGAQLQLLQRRFGGDRSVLGQQLRPEWHDAAVVGVMPPRFLWRGPPTCTAIAFRRGETDRRCADRAFEWDA